jgi:hypothetical protein
MRSLSTVRLLLVLTGIFAELAPAHAADIPKNFALAPDSTSPNGRYAVLVPVFADFAPDYDTPADRLFDLRSGRVLGDLVGNTGCDRRLNHVEVMPSRWSADSSLLLWFVGGKWFPWAYVVARVQDGKLLWQVDLLAEAQKAILARTKAAAPERYAAAKKANAGSGSAYPEGFTVNVKVALPLKLPLKVRAVLTANPKMIEAPDMPNLDSSLEAVVDKDGKFTVTGFRLETENAYNSEVWGTLPQ